MSFERREEANRDGAAWVGSARVRILGAIYVGVLLALIAGGCAAFVHLQRSLPSDTTGRLLKRPRARAAEYVLELRADASLVDAAKVTSGLTKMSAIFYRTHEGYYRIQEIMRGHEAVAAKGLHLDVDAWRHIALVPVQHQVQVRTLMPAASRVLRRSARETIEIGRQKIVLLFDPEELPPGTVYLYGDPVQKTVFFAVPESRLELIEAYLE